nr:putative ribonuclease H-like domain-containing protein [Tanacetum cinerariifolium]
MELVAQRATSMQLLHQVRFDLSFLASQEFFAEEHDDDIQKSVSSDMHSSSCGDLTREQGDKVENKDKGKSPVVTITGFRDLNKEFAECINNSNNEVNAAGSLVSAAGINFTNSTNDFSAAGPSNAAMPNLEDLSHNVDDVGAKADTNNMESIISVSPILTTRIHKDHTTSQIIGDLSSTTQTKSMARGVRDQSRISQMFNEDFHTCMFACFLSQEEPKRVHEDLKDPRHTQEEGIDYEEVFAPVAIIEAIRLFLAYASFMGFPMYQMDVKSAFLYDTIEEEVYVCQPPRFEDPEYLEKVYKVVKVLYGLHQAPRAWYETLATYLLENGFQRGTIDQTLFIKKQQKDILLVQIYVDDIIFGATNKALCQSFEKLMKDKFQMSSIGELTFFLGLQFWNTAVVKRSGDVTRVGKGFSGVETPLFENMLAVKDVDEEEEAQVPAQGDDVQEHAAEEVATEVVPPIPTSPSPSSHVIPSSPPHQSPCPPQPQDAEGLSHLFQQNTKGYKMEFFKGKTYDEILPIFQVRFDANMKFLFKSREEMEKEDEEIIKGINKTPAQKAAKRRKLSKEAQKADDLKKRLEILPDEDDDVFVEATPLAQKVLVVDYQVVVIDNKPKYKIIRADDTHQFYISFITLLKNFDREDLETL